MVFIEFLKRWGKKSSRVTFVQSIAFLINRFKVG